MTRLRHYDNLGTARFVTFSTFHRIPVLTKKPIVDLVLEEIANLRSRYAIKILGYVIMPDHIHLVLHPPEDCALGQVIGRLKGLSARRILPLLAQNPTLKGGPPRLDPTLKDGPPNQPPRERSDGRPAFWQKRCYDHNCRSIEIVREKINYCHKNPVTAGLVGEPGDWIWSSYGWYHGIRQGPIEVDPLEL